MSSESNITYYAPLVKTLLRALVCMVFIAVVSVLTILAACGLTAAIVLALI